MNKLKVNFVFCFFLSVPLLHAMQPFQFHEVDNLISALAWEYSPTDTSKSFCNQSGQYDGLGWSLHLALSSDELGGIISPRLLNYLVGVKCRFCCAVHVTADNLEKKKLIQKERYDEHVENARVAFVQKMAEETRDLAKQGLAVHFGHYNKVTLLNAVMNGVGFIAKKALHRLPTDANVIFLGRTPVLLYHLVCALARFGNDKACSLTAYHVNFSGKPNVDIDKQKDFADVFTPEALDFYIDNYLSAFHFDPTINELYIVDFMSSGRSMEAFLKIFAEFWRRRVSTTQMPKVIVLNLPFNESDLNIDPNSEAGFSFELRSRAHVEHLLTSKELGSGIDSLDCGFRAGDCTSKALGEFSLSIVGEEMMYSSYQRAGGVHYPHRFWNQDEAWRLNQTINARGQEQMESVIHLAYVMTLNDPNAKKSASRCKEMRDKLYEEMAQKKTADEFKISRAAKKLLGKRVRSDDTSQSERWRLEEYIDLVQNPFAGKPPVDWDLLLSDIQSDFTNENQGSFGDGLDFDF